MLSEDEIIDKINYMINNWHRNVVEIDIQWIQGLLDLYKQEKEWNQKIIKAEKFYRELYNDVVKKTNERYIPKDKIRAKIEEVKRKREEEWETAGISMLGSAIDVLLELLEEN